MLPPSNSIPEFIPNENRAHYAPSKNRDMDVHSSFIHYHQMLDTDQVTRDWQMETNLECIPTMGYDTSMKKNKS